MANLPTAGHVGITQHHATARVFGGIGTHQVKHVRPMRQIRIIAIHDFNLAEVDRLNAGVNVLCSEEQEPELGLWLAHVRH